MGTCVRVHDLYVIAKDHVLVLQLYVLHDDFGGSMSLDYDDL